MKFNQAQLYNQAHIVALLCGLIVSMLTKSLNQF
jgi:hypothetical protein